MKVNKYRDYTDEEMKKAIEESFSIAQILKKLGLRPSGGNYQTVRRFAQLNNIDTTHWTGKIWNKGKQLKLIGNYSKPYKIKEILARKRQWKCECCHRRLWKGKKIPLEIHHIDLDRTNNSEINLQLCCRNCHFVIHGKK